MDDRKSPEPSNPKPLAGGGPLALLMIAGVIVGSLMGQPSIGLLAGTALGIALAIIIWLKSRPR